MIDTFSGIAVERLREVWDLVRPYPNWKGPIAAIVPMAAASAIEIEAAVIFFAGGRPSVERLPGGTRRWHVLGAGYYEWVGA